MKTYQAHAIIKASPDTIWSVLTDATRYPEWDPTAERIEGQIALGETIKAYSKLSPGRAFPVKVTEFVPGQKMVWASGMPLGLFKGVRTFTLTPQPDGSTAVHIEEVFSGLLMPIIGRTIPDLSAAFELFVGGLKKRSEGTDS